MLYILSAMGQQEARSLSKKYQNICRFLDERTRRMWAAAEAMSLPYGGVSLVARATGLSRSTVHTGIRELKKEPQPTVSLGRSRKAGGGRKALAHRDPDLLHTLDELLEPSTRGHIESPLRWTCKSMHDLAFELQKRGYRISDRTVAGLLHQMEYRLQPKSKSLDCRNHPNGDAQFEYINAQAQKFLDGNLPVIVVDIKKKDLTTNFDNGCRTSSQGKEFEQRMFHDVPDKERTKMMSTGSCDGVRDQAWLSPDIDGNTAEFALGSILSWWKQVGCKAYSQATDLLIVADARGSMPKISRLLKVVSQGLANRAGLQVHVSHFPRGASKWSRIEDRMFFLTVHNWPQGPPIRYETVVSLIGGTKTRAGGFEWIREEPLKRAKLQAAESAEFNLQRATFYGDWNYSVLPQGICRE